MTEEPFKIAVVVPRYGANVLGGAETLAREFAEEAVKRGWSVTVWTSCAADPFDWRNKFSPGKDIVNGVVVERFKVTPGDPPRSDAFSDHLRIHHNLPVDEQYEWLLSGPQSAALYEHTATHAAELDAVIALPYLSSLVYHAAWLALEKTILWPCLHDEVFAYLEPFRLLAQSVRGIFFNTPEEMDLALNTIGWQPKSSAVTGVGVSDLKQDVGNGVGVNPYLMYIGRLEHDKNLELLFDYSSRYFEEENAFRLILTGTGPLEPPPDPPFRQMGFVAESEKAQLLRSVLALCQPSEKESFSLAIMESWLAERPVLVSKNCPVTAGHVARSRGGLCFRTYGEFAEAIRLFRDKPELAKRMGLNGRRYVKNNYSWTKVLSGIAQILTSWMNSEKH